MDSLRYTVIIPMPRFQADEPALVSLGQTSQPGGGMEILVAEGEHPARQRNAALVRARGEIIIFLDDDCSICPGYWKELESIQARPEVQIVGGPALLRSNPTWWEEVFHALLTHTLVVGSVSARYSPRGEFRPATQTDLILCNLAVRRSIFEKIGPLSTELYPNEENEWLDRAHAAGVRAYYDPHLQVFRPQRASPGQMALTLLRYGVGRTRQFRVSGWRPTFHQFLPFMVVATFAALLYWRLEKDFIVLWLMASACIALTCSSLRPSQRIVAGLLAPLIPLTYSLGQVFGWMTLFSPRVSSSTKIILRDEHGEEISP